MENPHPNLSTSLANNKLAKPSHASLYIVRRKIVLEEIPMSNT